MRKKDKKKKKEERDEIEEPGVDALDKFEIISRIDKLSGEAQNYKIKGNFEEAIRTSSEIVKLAMHANLPSHIEAQDKFLKTIAKEVKKDHIISEILSIGERVKKMFDVLIASNDIPGAHDLVEEFKNKYQNISYFNTIPLVRDLILEDNKKWILFQSQGEAVEAEPQQETSSKDEFLELLNELKK